MEDFPTSSEEELMKRHVWMWGGIVTCRYKLCPLITDPICFSLPVQLPQNIGDSGANSLFPTVGIPCMQLPVVFSNTFYHFSLLTRRWLVWLAMLPLELLSSQPLLALERSFYTDLAKETEMDVLGGSSWRRAYNWTVLVGLIFCLLAFLLSFCLECGSYASLCKSYLKVTK